MCWKLNKTSHVCGNSSIMFYECSIDLNINFNKKNELNSKMKMNPSSGGEVSRSSVSLFVHFSPMLNNWEINWFHVNWNTYFLLFIFNISLLTKWNDEFKESIDWILLTPQCFFFYIVFSELVFISDWKILWHFT